ncbi:MAG: ComEC family competence protein [Candidatus Sungiibacteriota bacterium]|uniref:ComEC family competence protein n=1 Tax=Candidatus Sungiibacteriota bacterium TaxID=2750080 RepID=A0A7T5RIX4_9BACT|nr:MAG: ComEC family competence protein [Candidatus Sungbacteria bacterium]
MTKSRIFLFLLLAFVAGVAVRSFISVSVFMIWFGILLAVVVVILGIFKKQKAATLYGFLFLAFLAGIFRFMAAEHSPPDLTALYGNPITIQGIVVEEPEQKETTQHLKVKIGSFAPNFYTLATTRKYPEYKMGDELKIAGLLQKPENYDDFDYISYLAKEDIYSTMSFPLIEKVGERRGNKLRISLSEIKKSFEEKIDRVLPEPHASFLKGLLLGERGSLPKDLVENFNRTGTTHIVALSGYNITLVGRFFVNLLLFLTIPFQISFWVASVAIMLFVILTGASPSVVRAGIMGILVLVANREGRSYHMTNALVLAGAVMIFQNPKILRFDTAFQLSFLATIGLVYLSPYVENYIDRIRFRLSQARARFILERKKSFKSKQILTETLSAQLMVLPLLIYLFGRVSFISPITNVLILLAVPYSMAVGFAAGALGFLWEPLSLVAGYAVWFLLEYKIRTIELFGSLPYASLQLGEWFLVPLVLGYGYVAFRLWKKAAKTQN